MSILPRTALDSPQAAVVTASLVVLSVVSFIAVSCRLFARLRISCNAGFDDFLLVVALGFLIIFDIYICSELLNRLKVVEYNQSLAAVASLLQSEVVAMVIYCIATAATRISVLLQYLRFLSGHKTKWACWIMMGISMIYSCYSGVTSAIAFRCFADHEFLPEPTLGHQCQGIKRIWLASGVSNIVISLLILSIPIPAIVHLQVSMKQKLAVLAVFTVGALVCVITIFRLRAYVQWKAALSDQIGLAKSAETALWTHAELSSSIICASLPGIKPIFQICCGVQRKSLGTHEVAEMKMGLLNMMVKKEELDAEKGVGLGVMKLSAPPPVLLIKKAIGFECHNVYR
ncbi:histone deacetylase [Phlyctema vagabunda]|uniref:Histone deacetylase n=1 Tax=Phlyctema vagabunda TaxID=108571 RepID=A0ABR4PLJ3_9HELO